MKLRLDESLSSGDIGAILSAIGKWEAAIGKKLIVIDETSSNLSNSTKHSQFRGDKVNQVFRSNNWDSMVLPKKALAVTILEGIPASSVNNQIREADVRFNSMDYDFTDSLSLSGKPVVDMESVAVHELGHFLGLEHSSDSVDGKSAKNPTVMVGRGYANRELSPLDVSEIRSRYGCSAPANCE